MALAATSAVLFSAKAIVAKLTYRYDVDVVTVVALRMVLALPVFLAVALYHRRKSGPLPAADRVRLGLLGLFGYYLSVYLDFAGLAYISAGLERLILFLNPTLVLLLSAFVLRRRITRREWGALALSYAGIAAVFAHDASRGGRDVWIGSGLVFGAAVSYAIYLTWTGELVRRLDPVRLSAIALSVAGVAAGAHFLLTHSVSTLVLPAPVYALALANALACTVAPVFLLALAIERVGAPTAAQTGMIGPVATLALGAWALGEPVTAWGLAGSALVLAGIALLSARRVDVTPG